MDGEIGFIRVHLQSLKDFALRLQEQLEVVQRPGPSFERLRQAPDLPLAGFAEAFSVSDAHSDALGQFATVLQAVTRNLDFASSVTTLVAQRYDALTTEGARDIAAVSGGLPAAPAMPVPVTGTAAAPPGSVAPPEVLARLTVPVPPQAGTVYYSNGSTSQPVSVTVQATDT